MSSDREAGGFAARNPTVQALRRLVRRRSSRTDADRFVVEGPRLVIDALDAGLDVEAVYVPVDATGADVDALLARSAKHRVEVRWLASGVIDHVASTVNPQPALAVVRVRRATLDAALHDVAAPLVIVLCDVADPGNAGTLVRVAEAAGASCVVVCGAAAVDMYNPKVVRAAAGSSFRLPVVVIDDPVAALDELAARGLHRVATVADAGLAYDALDWRGSVALVLGNEAHGLSPEVLGKVDGRVSIPMGGRVESLNVGVAGAVVAFEAARQRR